MLRRPLRPLLLIGCLLLQTAIAGFAAEPERYQRSVEKYTIPDVVLINQDGDKIRLKTLLESEQPVAVDFIYATCTTICPILSAGYANLQRKLGTDSAKGSSGVDHHRSGERHSADP